MNYYMVTELGGGSCFDFVVKAHQFVSVGKIAMKEWHKLTKNIFKQMMESIEYIHAQNICHFVVSLGDDEALFVVLS